MTSEEFRELALSFSGTIEQPHFDKIAFKVIYKRIFATLNVESALANLKLLPSDQPIYCSFNKKDVYPVTNKWGLHGWTTFELEKVPKELMLDALNTAYEESLKPNSKKKQA